MVTQNENIPGSTQPFYSIVIPTCNRPPQLKIALDAIATQSYQSFEVLIINNGTRPELVPDYEALEKEFDERFIFLSFHNQQAQGFGPAIARNIGIEQAKSEYVAFCDDDDKWTHAEYLQELHNYIQKYEPEMILAEQTGIRIVDNQEICERPVWFKGITHSADYDKVEGKFGQIDFNYFNTTGSLPHLNISVYKKSLLKKVNMFDRGLWYEEDLDLFLRAAQHCEKISHYNQVIAKHYIPNKAAGVNITSNVDDLKKHQVRCYIAHKLLLSSPNPALNRYATSLLTYAAKHITVHFINEKSYKSAFYYAKMALAASFSYKWLGYTCYLSIKQLIKQ